MRYAQLLGVKNRKIEEREPIKCLLLPALAALLISNIWNLLGGRINMRTSRPKGVAEMGTAIDEWSIITQD